MTKLPVLATLCALGVFQVFTGSCAVTEEPITGDDRNIARDRYDNYCAGCHGLDGRGNGPSSSSLNPKPVDFTDPDWQDLVSDEDIYVVIAEGTAAVGLSAQMPPSPFADQPGVINALVEIVRSYR